MHININLDTSEVWLPPKPSDFGLGDKKSHFWQNAPITDWSKEQVSYIYTHIYLFKITKEYIFIKILYYRYYFVYIYYL